MLMCYLLHIIGISFNFSQSFYGLFVVFFFFSYILGVYILVLKHHIANRIVQTF